jgi:rhamnose transport system permease protein
MKQQSKFLKNAEASREMGLIVFIIIVCVLIQFRNKEFLTLGNLTSLLTNTAILSILSVGMMMVLLTGGIDLSIGATMALSGMITALTVNAHPTVPTIFLLLEGTLIGALAGVVVGVLIAKFSILPIIASLGLMNVIRGLTYVVSGGKWVSDYQMPAYFKNFETSSMFVVNNLVIIAIVTYIV